jgi:hypothetical protein
VYIRSPVVHDDKLWFYYHGSNYYHSALDFAAKETYAQTAIGLATLPLDGFISMDAGPNPGQILTKPLVFTGTRLTVNFEASLKGSPAIDEATSLQIRLIDLDGGPMAGGRSNLISQSGIHQTVAWQDPGILAKLSGRALRLSFEMRNGKLYSFQFSN